VQQAGEDEADVVPDTLPVKARKQRGRASPVKAFVVIEDPDFQAFPLKALRPAPEVPEHGCEPKANRNAIPKKICQARRSETGLCHTGGRDRKYE
jgi:hypothetical protein